MSSVCLIRKFLRYYHTYLLTMFVLIYRYTEQNKEDGQSFRHTIGAEIIYCKAIEGVFITIYLFDLLLLFKLKLIALYLLLPSLGISTRENKYK